MRNWLGQDIVPGSVVYRGARDGNTSSYKVGVVESVKDGKARVAWQYEPGRAWRKAGVHRDYIETVHRYESKGSPSIETLILMDSAYLDYCKAVVEIAKEWQDSTMPVSTYQMLVDNLNIV